MRYLKAPKSAKVIKVPAAIMKLAIGICGSRSMAQQWLKLPKRRFGGLSPLQRLAKPDGARAVEDLLTLLQKGIFDYA